MNFTDNSVEAAKEEPRETVEEKGAGEVRNQEMAPLDWTAEDEGDDPEVDWPREVTEESAELGLVAEARDDVRDAVGPVTAETPL